MRLALTTTAVWLALAAPAFADHSQLAGQWHLDDLGAAPDSSGHGLNGTVASADLVPGRFGNAFSFAAGGNVRIPGSPLLEPQRLTVVAWVRANAVTASDYVLAKGGDDVCTNSSYALGTGPAGGLVFSVRRDDGSGNAFPSPSAPPSIWDGQWHAVAGTYDGATVRLYVDGAQVGNGTPGVTAIPYARDDDTLAIGTYPQCANSGFDFPGAVDEVRVYNRALTAPEVGVLHDPGATAPPALPESGGGGGGPAATPPTAVLVTAAKSPTLKRASWLSGAASTAVEGKSIVKYAWDFNDDGRIDGNCGGEAPAVSHPFQKAGTQTVALTVTDSAGLSATVKQTVSVARANVNVVGRAVYDCERPLGGNQPDRPGCVKTFAFGYLEVNGRGGADQCFEIEGRPRERLRPARVAQKVKLKDALDYKARIDGPVALNGLPIPVPKGVKSEYDSGKDTIGIGTFPILVPSPDGGEQIKLADVPLEKKIEFSRTRDYPDGVATLFSAQLKPNLKGWGGLKRAQGVEVLLLRRASIVKLAVNLPNVFTIANQKSVEAWAAVRATNADGFTFDGMRLGPVDAFLGPVIVSNIQFTYNRSAETWSGGADIQLLPAGVTIKAAPPVYGLGLRRGAFDYAGFGAKFEIPPQLFPGIGLREIGGAVGIRPLRFTGRLAINAAKVVTIDGTAFMAFASPEQPYTFTSEMAPPGLGALAGRRMDSYTIALGGTASLAVPRLGEFPLVESYVFYAYPDYVEFGGKAELKVLGDRFKVKGQVDGFADVGSELFNLEGQVEACLDLELFDACPSVGAVVSSKGIGFCTIVPIPVTPFGPVIPVPAGVGYKWGDAWPPDVMVFSCDRGPYRESKPSAAAAQAGTRTFTVPRGAPSASVRISGSGGPPSVVLSGPRGERIALPQTDPSTANPGAVSMAIPETSTTQVFLKDPSPGRWTVTGSTVSGVASAAGLPVPRVRARVIGRGHRRTLVYSGARRGIAFVERGARTSSPIGRARGARGRIRFAPADGSRGRREIVALIERNGVTTQSATVARYAAPGPARPARPRGLRVKRRRDTLTVSWKGSGRGFAVTVDPRVGPTILKVTRGHRVRIRGLSRRARGTVRVGALGPGTRTGPQARRAIPR
jgi:PKD repeat protein